MKESKVISGSKNGMTDWVWMAGSVSRREALLRKGCSWWVPNDREDSKCKGPGVGMNWTCVKESKKSREAGMCWVRRILWGSCFFPFSVPSTLVFSVSDSGFTELKEMVWNCKILRCHPPGVLGICKRIGLRKVIPWVSSIYTHSPTHFYLAKSDKMNIRQKWNPSTVHPRCPTALNRPWISYFTQVWWLFCVSASPLDWKLTEDRAYVIIFLQSFFFLAFILSVNAWVPSMCQPLVLGPSISAWIKF